MKRLRRYACCCFLPGLALAAAAALALLFLLRPMSSTPHYIRVDIPVGATPLDVARVLKERGLIRSEAAFLAVAFHRGALKELKAGRHRLSPHQTPEQILDRLLRGGAGEEISVTIPEGFTLRQIAARLEKNGVIQTAAEFLRIVSAPKPALQAPFDLPRTTLEGYLFPETYRFPPRSDPRKVAQTMLDTFVREFYELHRAEVERSGHSLHEIVTVASLIEREAELPQDRARIAGVIQNRLRRGKRLEIDATVLYALGEHKDRVLFRDLKVESPYNTYRHQGLPPGPIACPGAESLRAALHPEAHDYLFYVAAPDRSHIFARTLEEHNRNVARVRALQRGRP